MEKLEAYNLQHNQEDRIPLILQRLQNAVWPKKEGRIKEQQVISSVIPITDLTCCNETGNETKPNLS